MEVRAEGLRFLRGRHEILAIPALTFSAGRTTALLGPNGAGKSTLLRLIAALERPASGDVLIGGRPARHDRETRDRLAYAFQEPVFLTGSVRANLELGMRLRGVGRGERLTRVEEAATALGIGHLLDRNAHRLSGGEAQRANLGRALSLRAPVTLLDEPLSGLDGPARRQLLHDLPALLRDFATTTILVTHDRDEALRLADDLVILTEGRVRAAGPKREVVLRPPDPVTAALLGYTVIGEGPGAVAIAPGSLRAGPGDVTFTLAVDEVVDLATHREVSGLIGATRVSIPLPDGTPPLGAALKVSAPATSVVSY